MKYLVDYPFIRADCVYWGSHKYYLEDMLETARRVKAPTDAVTFRGWGDDAQDWRRLSEYPEGSYKGQMVKIAVKNGWIEE